MTAMPLVETVIVRRVPPVIPGVQDTGTSGRSAQAIEADHVLPFLERLVLMLDLAWGIPGTPLRFGVDSIIGLIPGVGDAAMSLVSLVLVFYAIRWKLPVKVIALMLGYVAIDLGIGAVPVVGDIGDTLFKANLYNLRLLQKFRPQ